MTLDDFRIWTLHLTDPLEHEQAWKIRGVNGASARDFLAGFWELMQELGVRMPLKPGSGLDARMLRFNSGVNHALNVCTVCGLMQSEGLQDLCTAFGCTGQTRQLSPAERDELWTSNHYL